jgi:hypothetical protein
MSIDNKSICLSLSGEISIISFKVLDFSSIILNSSLFAPLNLISFSLLGFIADPTGKKEIFQIHGFWPKPRALR